jgi:uncharacterized protein YbcC (UPF0753/DUF2309 family)
MTVLETLTIADPDVQPVIGWSPAVAAARAACAAIPPAWPLAATVAVNPFLGQSEVGLAEAGARLARVAGAPVFMPRRWYRDRLAEGAMSAADLAAALAASPHEGKPTSLDALMAELAVDAPAPAALPTIADHAADISGIDWPAMIADRFGAWAAGYFDEGQALWAAPRGKGAYAAWRAVATHDLTPEIAGLAGFAAFVADAPEEPGQAIARASATLGLAPEAMETAFHRLLITLGGWAQMARYRLWQAEMAGAEDAALTDFLAIRLLWDEALYRHYGDTIASRWAATAEAHRQPAQPSRAAVVDEILQDALERGAQRRIAEKLAQPAPAADAAPVLQAAFCIDVRSEVFRRALESVDPRIQTLGFAGFFGLGASHRRFASDIAEHRLPVLLNPAITTRAGGAHDATADMAARVRSRASRAWGRFKLAAVSSFAFVEASGPMYIVKLIGDALGLVPASKADPAPQLDPALDLATRIGMARSVLGAMSLTSGFAPLVILAGHGANTVNNPHASALHCGACGGYSGEVNARLLAALLNDRDVRAGLLAEGLAIPDTTQFVAALHDTTTDEVTLYNWDTTPAAQPDRLAQARQWLAAAGLLARAERALKLPRAVNEQSVVRRSRDWSETRPEWALAGCEAFIAAPRSRTAGRDFAGRAFLHDYYWRTDEGFGVLELILTAPVVVASWISLQYYGSTVAPQLFGAGNKLLHNVVGGFGVVEGNGGTLRVGLPWQSVHDGDALMHEPLRLSVCIEAPREEMSAILDRHPGVRSLFRNGWLHLFALDDAGRMAWRYTPTGAWEAVA